MDKLEAFAICEQGPDLMGNLLIFIQKTCHLMWIIMGSEGVFYFIFFFIKVRNHALMDSFSIATAVDCNLDGCVLIVQ